MAVEVRGFRRSDSRGVIGVLADAFLDDPVWTAIGPRNRAHRKIANRASFAGILAGSARHGARIRVARSEGRIAGATIAFAPGDWPIPDLAALWELGWLFVAGPRPALRGMRDDRAIRATHVEHRHTYLWFIGVDPSLHGRGVGRALMADVHAAADPLGAPTYLETGTEANVGFYRSLGYEAEGEIDLPSGGVMWRMERPAPAPAAITAATA